MNVTALINHHNVHNSPSAERFYRLQVSRNGRTPSGLTSGSCRSSGRRPKAPDLTRDQKVEIRTLRFYANWPYNQIVEATGRTYQQVQDACTGPLTPQKPNRCGRKPLIRTPEKDVLIQYLRSDVRYRELPWPDLRYFIPGFELFSEQAIYTALQQLGYLRSKRPRRIHLTDFRKARRLAFAYEQLALRPRPEDWERVLFSDETWATNSYMWKKWITRHETEDPNTWALLRQKPHGWMFWGSFAGGKKGPSFFWEKKYGGINAPKYQMYIVPLVYTFVEEQRAQGTSLVFQQDNASGHRAKTTKRLLSALGIETLQWPAYSPDLSPIENVWPWLKAWIEDRYDLQSLSLEHLRPAIAAAWEAVPEDLLLRLAHSMPRRLQLVIENEGGEIRY
jgi:DDE superfamily endonuclease